MTSSDGVETRNAELARKLLTLTGGLADGMPNHPADLLLHDADAIVSHIEVNSHHGVGVLIRRLFGASRNILSIRSKDFYEGHQEFGARRLRISHDGSPRDLVFWRVLQALAGVTVRRVLCVPYFPDDVLNAIALKELFGVPLCTYLMDDQNLYSNGIPDAAMDELLAKSALRLAISSELCEGYERKYGRKMWFMPPVVDTGYILPHLNALSAAGLAGEGMMIGNVWGQRWLELLRATVRDSGVTLRWHCSGEFRWVSCGKDALIQDGIVPHDGPALADEPLIALLRQAPFAVVPSGTLDETDDRRFIAQLSLPSRIPYIFATAQTPILVFGSPETAAARFVTRLGIGMNAPYDRESFQMAVRQITTPHVNLEMRRAALRWGGLFADRGAAEWIWASLAKGEPLDSRYDVLQTPPEPGSAAH
jgi:hypothetical protein